MALRQEQTWCDQKMAGCPGGLRRQRAGGEGRGCTWIVLWCGAVPLQCLAGTSYDLVLSSKE